MNPFRAQQLPSRTRTHQPAQQHSTHLLDGSLVNTAALVDKMSGGGGLSRVDVADNDAIQSAHEDNAEEAEESRGLRGKGRRTRSHVSFLYPLWWTTQSGYADGCGMRCAERLKEGRQKIWP